MKVSIIIPVYNSYKTLSRCLDSIISQTYTNIEIIIINNNSNDKSINIINKYTKKDKRIIALSEKNRGVSYARNLGINKSTGDYIMFVDSDDYIEQNAVEVLIDNIKNNKCNVIRAYFKSDVKTYDNQKKYLQNHLYYKKEINNILIPNILNQSIGSYIWLLLIKKDLLNNIKFNEKLYIHQDLYFYIELLSNINSIYFTNTIIYNYKTNPDSSKSKQYYKRNIYNILDLYNELNNLTNNKQLISNLCFSMMVPYFGKIYFNNKELFNTIYKDFKYNTTMLDIYNNINKKDIRLDILFEYICLFKISKYLYILYLKIITLFKLKKYK